MATVVELPRLSDTMEEGVIAKWRIKVGDKVKRGQVIAEIETDKATMEFESFDSGTVLKLIAAEGETLPIGAAIAVLGAPGEDPDAGAKPAGTPAAGTPPASTPATPKIATKEEGAHGETKPAGEPGSGAEVNAPPPPAPATGSEEQVPTDRSQKPAGDDGRVPASPLARRLAREHDLELGGIQGSGPHGRVVKADVDQAIAAGTGGAPQKPAPAPAAATAGAPAAGAANVERPAAKVSAAPGVPGAEADADGRPYVSRPTKTIKLTQMRKTIVKRMGQSKREAPHIYLTTAIRMDRAMAIRAELNLAVDGTKISVNDLIVLACARALRKHPKVNSNYTEQGILEYGDIHVGVAVALDDGLVVPMIRFADQKTISAISRESRDLGLRAKNKELRPEEMTGSTFTISNLGMLGVESFMAVVNPGESAILAVGATNEEAVVDNGAVVVRKVMRVTLCSDHRAFDGADSARFLQTLKSLLENPMALFG
ncbi:MAG: 2-oxo acid dehydrogenase subunit E2 [Nannocystis sp.]|nr:dihydrolipoamide acetyltransferase family protein [Nannocystis sp.]MBA3547619.1 2-oxo acid dehydrogenase subunit E2 [Nannocystis sp.]